MLEEGWAVDVHGGYSLGIGPGRNCGVLISKPAGSTALTRMPSAAQRGAAGAHLGGARRLLCTQVVPALVALPALSPLPFPTPESPGPKPLPWNSRERMAQEQRAAA
jgi:hypothetical protein